MTDTELGNAICESLRYRGIVQNEVVRRFPINSKARVKVSGDVVTIWSTSPNVGNVTVISHERFPWEVSCFDLEPINDPPAET